MVYYPIAELRFDVSARLHSSVLPSAIHLSRCGSGLCSCEQVATTALTVHRTVIHYRNAASLPLEGGSVSRERQRAKAFPSGEGAEERGG